MVENQAPSMITPLDRLLLGLRLSTNMFDADADDGGRWCVSMSLTAIDDFLRPLLGREDSSVLNPFHQLQYALYDLGHGRVRRLLAPRPVSARPKNSVAIEGFRAFAAVAMDLFVKGGVPRKQAARDVARALSRMGYNNGPGKIITGPRVEDWRDRIMKKTPENKAAAARFHRMKKELETRYPEDLTAAARFLLARLPTVVPIPKKPRL
jgi:hypothetical protein